ncbi:Multi antimicrobial extrusion protein (Na(+)/drug antiporter) [Clostridiaceae bacterium JG1575]|nr:Multi antimicrobial extrusion protein (Na(+)/drug antiporter) [Clostridiaceae bacterium JG1575]
MRTIAKNKTELILSGPLLRVIWVISLPLMLNNLIMTLYHMADAVWVGQVGTTEFAAVGFVSPVLFLFRALGMGIQIAGTSIFAQHIGRGQKEEAQKDAVHLLLLTAGLGIFLGLLGGLITPNILRFMGAKGDFYELARQYLGLLFWGMPFQIFFMGTQAILNAQGNTKMTTWVNAMAALLNMVLDPFFILPIVPILALPGLGAGVRGAALATVLSQVLLAFVGFIVLKRSSQGIPIVFQGKRLDPRRIARILRVAIPSAAGHAGATVGFILLNSFIVSYGTHTMAAFSLVNRINDVVMMPAMGIGAALTAIVGQNIGAGAISRVKRAFRGAIGLSSAIAITGAVLIYWFRFPLIYLFTPGAPENMVQQCLEYMIYILPTLPLMGLFSILQGLFQGTGKTDYALYMAIGRLWVIRLPMILFFNRFFTLGARGIWIAMTASNVLIILYGFFLYRQEKWVRGVVL